MDFTDYTNILASANIITWQQAKTINAGMSRLENQRFLQSKEIEDEFWEDEGRYGSS